MEQRDIASLRQLPIGWHYKVYVPTFDVGERPLGAQQIRCTSDKSRSQVPLLSGAPAKRFVAIKISELYSSRMCKGEYPCLGIP